MRTIQSKYKTLFTGQSNCYLIRQANIYLYTVLLNERSFVRSLLVGGGYGKYYAKIYQTNKHTTMTNISKSNMSD